MSQREKTKLEIALDEYFQTFNRNFPLVKYASGTDNEIIDRIHECIRTKKKAPDPEFKKGRLY